MKKGFVGLSACLVLAGILSACSTQSTSHPATPASQETPAASQSATPSSQDSSAASQSATTPETNANQATEVKLDMNEFAYSMKEIKVHAGETVHFVLTNSGKIEHDINSEELNLDKDVEPGKTESFDWTAPTKAGTYQMICDKPGHKEKGMTLNLIVEN